MIVAGLCSITLRALGVAEVVRLAAAAGLETIEWGGDVHVPPGDAAAARLARKLTTDAGLTVASYGSYFRCDEPDAIEATVATAAELGAPRIRIWAGRVGSTEASAEQWRAVVDGARAIARRAAADGIEVGFEFHAGTLTDDPAAARRLVAEVGFGARTYWQPPVGALDRAALTGLRTVLPDLAAVHVFSWWPATNRLPLARRGELWREAFGVLRSSGRDHDALLEFVPDDDPALLAREAASLRELIG